MDPKLVQAKDMKSHEEYFVALALGIVSLRTLQSFHTQAVKLGLLREDETCRANTISWDINRLVKLYQDQAEGILELLPEGFSIEATLDTLRKKEINPRKKKAS
jgi:hypothetical protein